MTFQPRISKAAPEQGTVSGQVEVEATRRVPSNRDPEFEVALGARVRALRAAAGMTQSDLGAVLGISFQQVQKYEKGKDRVSASTLKGIATALQVHPGTFYDDDTVPTGDSPQIREVMRFATRLQALTNSAMRKHLMALVDELVRTQVGVAKPEAKD